MKRSDLLDAFEYVGGAAPYECTALINPTTGEVLLHSSLAEIDPIPDEILDSDAWLEVPHKKELGLGRELVFTFVSERLPDATAEVERIFRRRGAYGNFKQLLGDRGLLDAWYEHEEQSLHRAIRVWCEENGVPLTD